MRPETFVGVREVDGRGLVCVLGNWCEGMREPGAVAVSGEAAKVAAFAGRASWSDGGFGRGEFVGGPTPLAAPIVPPSAVVPLPPSAALLVTGAVILAVLRRRRP